MAFISCSSVFLLLSIITITFGQTPVCGPNEEFSTCGSSCTETCTHRPRLCLQVCRSGCFCEIGYVRQTDAPGSPCIKRESCQKIDDTPVCGANQRYDTCGSACVETCSFKPKICTFQCIKGCFCNEPDYVRLDNSANSPCVQRDQCPK